MFSLVIYNNLERFNKIKSSKRYLYVCLCVCCGGVAGVGKALLGGDGGTKY